MSSESDLLRNQAIQNQRNSFSREFPLPFNLETLQAFGALFIIGNLCIVKLKRYVLMLLIKCVNMRNKITIKVFPHPTKYPLPQSVQTSSLSF
jgi:hypothetical protein